MAQGFKKFMGKGDSGAKKKERIRQEKKKVRQETKEFFEKKKQEAREARAQGQAGGFQSERGRKEYEEKKAAGSTPHASRNTGKGFKGNEASRQRGNEQGKDATRQQGNEATRQRGSEKASGFKQQTGKSASSSTPHASRNTDKGFKGNEATRQRGNEKDAGNSGKGFKGEGNTGKPSGYDKASADKTNFKATGGKTPAKATTGKAAAQQETTVPGAMPLNKFIAHAGICSRRDAAEVVKSGKVIVNGEKILEPGHKVSDKDDIKVNGKKLFLRRNLVYILINKPKDFLTTTEDPQGRKTVMDIIRNATEERVYPIGRLDRNTTGVLLLTNDGELAQKLSHPSYEIKKIYEVKLDKPLIKKDFDSILSGVTLEDGFVAPDLLAYADPKDKSVIGIEIHSGRNRIVRRIFEHMGYDVRNLDRVMYANLTKKNVDRGKWRFLTEKEVRLLKYLNASYTKNKTASRG
jgi:23S rRNA pseudouridine2605 synthase